MKSECYPYGWTEAFNNLESYQERLNRYYNPVRGQHGQQDSADSGPTRSSGR